MKHKIKEKTDNLESQFELTRLISEISKHFFSETLDDFHKAINYALEQMGTFIHADRIYVFKYDFKESVCHNTYEWCEVNIVPFINELQNVPLDTINPWVMAHLNHDLIYIEDLDSISENHELYQILKPQGIQSLLAIPLYKDHELYGFLGIDSVTHARTFTSFELEALNEFSNLLIGVLRQQEMQAQIHSTNQLLDSIINAQSEFIVRLDGQGKILFANKKFESLNQLSTDSMIGQSIFEIAPPDAHSMLQSLIKGEIQFDTQKRYIFKGYDLFEEFQWIEWEGYPIFRDHGVVEYQLIGIDFSEIKQTEMLLEKERIQLNEIIKGSKIGTFEWLINKNKVTFNQEYANMLGYKFDELQEINDYAFFKSILHPDYIELFESELAKLFKYKDYYFSIDFKVRHKEGYYIWIHANAMISQWSLDGKPLVLYGTHIDISETKKKEEQLLILEQALESSPTSAVITDYEGIIQYVNPMFTKITGYQKEEVIGKNPNILKSGHHNDIYYQKMWQTIKKGKIWHGEFYNKKKDGTFYWESASIAPVIQKDGTISHFVATKIDITDKKLIEQELHAYNKKLELEVSEKIKEIADSQRATVMSLARLTESRDYTTGKHVDRVQYLCRAFAEALMKTDKYKDYINPNYINDIFYASILHDIGKIGIPDSILLKPGKLTDEEFNHMKEHVRIGAETLEEISKVYPKNRIIEMGIQIARYHHEKWNGLGYLNGARSEEIPLSARIMAIVDVYDALRSKRPYKEPMSHEEAVNIIKKDAGSHFDPYLVQVFLKIETEFDYIYKALE